MLGGFCMEIKISTGNRIVDAVARINITGNVIPEAWFVTIVNEKGNVNFLAINILADLVYWYRPAEIRDEHTNQVVFKKRFAANDFVQRSYSQLCQKFNISEKQAREALKLLEKLGVVKRHFRTIDTNLCKCSNVMFLELVPSVLEKLTFPSNQEPSYTDGSLEGNSYFPKSKYPLPCEEIDTFTDDNTYTEITTENKTENTTTLDAAHTILKPFSLNEQDIKKIINAANGDSTKIESAVHTLKSSRNKIGNIVGFLLSAIKNNYSSKSYTPTCSNSFNNYSQREYDFDELERRLLARSH